MQQATRVNSIETLQEGFNAGGSYFKFTALLVKKKKKKKRNCNPKFQAYIHSSHFARGLTEISRILDNKLLGKEREVDAERLPEHLQPTCEKSAEKRRLGHLFHTIGSILPTTRHADTPMNSCRNEKKKVRPQGDVCSIQAECHEVSGDYVRSLKNMIARLMLMNRTSITSCCFESQSLTSGLKT